MVAKITTPNRLREALYYNENKVAKGKAVCLYAEGFLRDANELSLRQKTQGFERLNCRNERAKTKTMHISLNFDPSEKLPNDTLRKITETYMKGIGFEGQPYLVYRHNDAGHPHIHILTTLIREDGTRINTHNIGRNQSEQTRKQIEHDFGLIKASSKKSIKAESIMHVQAGLLYGKTETREAINRVLNAVIQNYLFTSLAELSAVLCKYGVYADPGSKDSRVHQHKGLNFRLLDANGKPAGVPIKASILSGKPTLQKLESIFEKNAFRRETFKAALKAQMDEAIAQNPPDLFALKNILRQKNIDLILREAADGSGRIYGITIIDENNKVVINGGDLAKRYSAKHLTDLLKENANSQPKTIPVLLAPVTEQIQQENNLAEILLLPTLEFNHIPGALLKKKRKRKRKGLGL